MSLIVLLIFCILALGVIQLSTTNRKLDEILERIKKNDFSKEDAQVRAMTEQVAKATEELPSTEKPQRRK